MDDAVVKLIKQAAQQQSLVALIGAGASMDSPAKLPSWSSLVAKMAECAERLGDSATSALIKRHAAENNLIAAADYFSMHDAVPRKEREHFLLNSSTSLRT